MAKSDLLHVFATTLLCLSCKPMPPEYPLSAEMSRNKVDDTFIVKAAYWSQDAIDISHTILNVATDSTIIAFASKTNGRSNLMYQKLQNLGKGALVVPNTPSHHIHTVKQHILSKDEDEMHIEYTRYKVEAYEKIVDVFEEEISNGQFKPIKEYAIQQLPELQHQRKVADSILQTL